MIYKRDKMSCLNHRTINRSEQFWICSHKNYNRVIRFYKMNLKKKEKKKNIKIIIKLKENYF